MNLTIRPRNKRISDLPDFVGKKLLLEAQETGVRIIGGESWTTDAMPIMLIGLANILVERGIVKEI